MKQVYGLVANAEHFPPTKVQYRCSHARSLRGACATPSFRYRPRTHVWMVPAISPAACSSCDNCPQRVLFRMPGGRSLHVTLTPVQSLDGESLTRGVNSVLWGGQITCLPGHTPPKAGSANLGFSLPGVKVETGPCSMPAQRRRKWRAATGARPPDLSV